MWQKETMIKLVFWYFLIVSTTINSSLVPYGEAEGDKYIPHSTENTATVLTVPFVYFEKTFTELFISPNGVVAFGEGLPAEIVSLKNRNAIAIYYAKTTGGHIYWRVTKSQKTINDLTSKFVSAFPEAHHFHASEAVLVTYEDMLGENTEGLNIFQLGLLTNSTESYAVLIYSRLDYSSSAGRYAELGFFSSNGKVESLYNTGTETAKDIAKLSMMSEKGVYSYKTTFHPESGNAFSSNDDYEYAANESEYDSQEEQPADCPEDSFKEKCPPECNVVPDSRNCKMCVCNDRRRNSEFEGTQGSKKEETVDDTHPDQDAIPDTLPQQIVPIQSRQETTTNLGCNPSGESDSDVCHISGYCEAAGNGHCCKCSQDFFGNGKDCVSKIASLRGSGKFEGVITGQQIPSVDLFIYVETAAGAQQSSIGGLSAELVWSLQLLDTVGNGIAWLFSKVVSPDVENGFQLTGGIFNRTVNIHLGDKYSIVIKQEFFGRENDALRVNVFVSGTLPVLEPNSIVSFTDFEEKYTREEPGLLRAYADRHVVVKQGEQEVQHRLTVDQQIRYKECPFKQVKNNVTVVRVSRINVAYGQHDKTLRLSSESSVYNEEDARRIAEQNNNPCINSYHVCNQPNMHCKPENGQYRCECEAGYQYLQDDTVEPKFRCVDADECSNRPCDPNAQCTNTVGSYTCTCRPGYVGDGKRCTRDRTEIAGASSGCRSHSECHQWGECVFSDIGQAGYCKCRGWYVGDGLTHCGPPEVSYKVESNQYNDNSRQQQHPISVESCEKRLNCHFHAQCVSTGKPDPPALCQCRQGYEGNGTYCVNRDEIAVRLPTDNKVCHDQSDCNQNAHCTLRGGDNTYSCTCLPGYRGDGHTTCIKSEECDFNNPNTCGSNSQCRFSSAAEIYRCECLNSYVRQGEDCVPDQQPKPQETCDVNPYVCHPEANCVLNGEQKHVCVCKEGTVGDGYRACARQQSATEDVCRNCGSNSDCIRSQNNNYTCVCKAGFVGNGQTCQALKSCLDDRSLCSQNAQCMPDQRGSYVCNCNYGYSGNGYVCNPSKQDQSHPLLIARGMSIIQRSTESEVPGRQFIVVPHQVVVDIQYDCISDRIYWSDIAGFSIRSSTVNGTDVKTVFTEDLRSPEGIAIDYASRNIYYVDSIKDEIGVISIDGKYQKALVTEGLVNPRALAIDLDNRKLYYSDWHRRTPRIGRVDLDGQNNADFIKNDIGLPNGLVLLQGRRELCWVDAGRKELSCIRLDGTGRRVVYSPLEYPFGLTHENEERFYWTDWKDHKIHTVSIYGDGYRSFLPSVAGQGKIYGILSLNTKCQGKQTECSNNNGGCPFLCLPTQTGAKCECPDNHHDADC